MITNKDLSIDSKNGQVILNGDKYDLGTQGEINAAVKDVYSVMGQMGAKNLLVPKWTETQTTENGVTYTFNADGTVVMNTDESGATADTNCNLKNVQESTDNIYPAGTYTISGCPSGGTGSTYRTWVRAYRPGDSSSPLTGNLYDEGNGVTFTVNETFQLAINLTVRKNYVCNNLTWKPMLRYASDTDNTYQPYAKTNRQLTEVIGDLSQTGVTGETVAAQLGVLSNILSFTHFVQIPFTTGVLESIKAAFENGNIPVDVTGITFGIVGGQAGSQRVIFIAQNQSDPSTTQTRYAAIYFGSYTAPRFCQKQDGTAWTDVEL